MVEKEARVEEGDGGALKWQLIIERFQSSVRDCGHVAQPTFEIVLLPLWQPASTSLQSPAHLSKAFRP